MVRTEDLENSAKLFLCLAASVMSQTLVVLCRVADLGFSDKAEAYGDYQEMLNDPNIHAVYVPVPTGARKDIIIAAAQAKKHILSEKPPAVSIEQLKEILKVCKEQGVQYMDGVMFMHHERRFKIQQSIKDHNLGAVKYVDSDFSVQQDPSFFEENIRVKVRSKLL